MPKRILPPLTEIFVLPTSSVNVIYNNAAHRLKSSTIPPSKLSSQLSLLQAGHLPVWPFLVDVPLLFPPTIFLLLWLVFFSSPESLLPTKDGSSIAALTFTSFSSRAAKRRIF
jgi:hypothetical protein